MLIGFAGYQASLSYTPPPKPSPPPPPDARVSSSISSTVLGVAVAVPVVVVLLIVAGVAWLVLVWRPASIFGLGYIPGAGPETSLLITDIEDR